MTFIPQISLAQGKDEDVTDDLGNVTDKFQEHFFEALKQKGIENYDRALEALEKAAKESPGEVAVYFEMAKNHGYLKQWEKAETHYNKVLEMEPGKPEAFSGLYDVYYNTNNYEKAIVVVKKLIPLDKDYKEDLANLYERTEQYDKALQILEELDQELGNSDYRNQLRQQIYMKSDNAGSQISDLEQRIKRTPVNEQDFLNLIYLYSESNDKEAAFTTAKKLIQALPDSELAHLALYKFYLDANRPDEAFTSMETIFKSDKIDTENKFKVLNDFLLFVNENPVYEEKMEEMVTVFSQESKNDQVYEQLAGYYLKKEMQEEALKYFELGVKNNPGNYNLIKNTLLLQIDFKKFEKAEKLSNQSLDLFPSQPLLYLLNGVANLNLDNTSKAKTMLETGLDYLIDDSQMERDFYLQLSKVYSEQGNAQKAEEFQNRAIKISQTN
ncbi:tetratricopeptide repeat protein [uncultured Planktosalinus sp.]|uniref:tetratricopeptide repeat protein n=1 Tax=uncultured Planktosalinus sp. TaxID=1810935 RepID=UPI0030D891D2